MVWPYHVDDHHPGQIPFYGRKCQLFFWIFRPGIWSQRRGRIPGPTARPWIDSMIWWALSAKRSSARTGPAGKRSGKWWKLLRRNRNQVEIAWGQNSNSILTHSGYLPRYFGGGFSGEETDSCEVWRGTNQANPRCSQNPRGHPY